MAVTSRFFHLEDQILIEYIYTDQGSPTQYSTADRGFNLISNGYTNTKLLLPEDDVQPNNPNVRDNSAILVDSFNRKWASLDIDIPLHYQDYDNNITDVASMPIAFSPDYNVTYDQIKVHIPTGYDFKNKDGFLIEVKVRQKDGSLHSLSSLVYRVDSNYGTINPKPLLIGDRLYDSYILFDIPATYYVVQDFDSTPLDTNLLGYRITDGQGLTTNNPIYVSIYFINETFLENGFVFYKTTEENRISLNQIDEFAEVSATITESSSGDYFELTGSVTGSTLEDYIGNLNNQPNSDWIIIHEIQVTEQVGVGASFLQTADLNFIQDTNFEEPLLFRPIVLNSGNVASWSIDYALRLFNRYDNSQIIKLASEVYTDASKYGRYLQSINLGIVPTIDKIYNLVQSTQYSLPETLGAGTTSTKYIANFFDRYNISITSGNELKDLTGNLNNEVVNNDITDIFKPSEGFIVIRPYDNYIKFTLYKLADDTFQSVDITQLGLITLQFISDNGNKIKYNSLVDDQIFPVNGELLFLIPEEDTSKILNFDDKSFFIVLSNDNGIDTIVYSGSFLNQKEFKEETQETTIVNLKKTVKGNNSTISKLTNDIEIKDNEINTLNENVKSNEEEIANLKAQIIALQNGESISNLKKTNPSKKQKLSKNKSTSKFITTEIDDEAKIIKNDSLGLTLKAFKPTIEEGE